MSTSSKIQRRLLEHEANKDPVVQFASWFAAAAEALEEAEAFTLATATPDGFPAARMLLLKGFDEQGFRFFTNYRSRKGDTLAANPAAAMLFWWGPLGRQVRVEGQVQRLPDSDSDRYFATRSRGSQISAWASTQSTVVPDRETLERQRREIVQRFAGRSVPRPPQWGGYLLGPALFEFWQSREHRFHDRLRYRWEGNGAGWVLDRLSP